MMRWAANTETDACGVPVACGHAGNDTTITNEQVVHVMGFKIGVDHRGLGVDPGAAGSHQVCSSTGRTHDHG